MFYACILALFSDRVSPGEYKTKTGFVLFNDIMFVTDFFTDCHVLLRFFPEIKFVVTMLMIYYFSFVEIYNIVTCLA